MRTLLAIHHLVVHYGRAVAVDDLSISIGEGEVVTLIGSNGAGKSTILRTISGMKKQTSGDILLDGSSISGLPPHQIVRLGVAHVPEGRRIFPYLTVHENLRMGAYSQQRRSEWSQELPGVHRHFPILKERARQFGRTLSGGEQQMLAIGRGLMAKPRLLLLDEPSLGLSPIMCKEIAVIIRHIRDEFGVAILLVEQNARLALKLADRGYVLATGRVAVEGTASSLTNNDAVRRAYLGL